MRAPRGPVLFCLVLLALIVAQFPGLRLPYFWDEAGYFAPAAMDLFATGDPIPHSVAPNPHPPLVMATLAAAWHLFGLSIAVARLTMLGWAAVALCAVFALARRMGGVKLGLVSCLCVSLYPIFFAQSSLTQLDLPAAAMTLWTLVFYLNGRLGTAAAFLCAAVLCKETAIAAAAILAALELWRPSRAAFRTRLTFCAVPAIVLAAWFGFVYLRTGSVLGNAEFARYNAGAAALDPSRLAAALLMRTWHATGHFFLFLLTIPAAWCVAVRRDWTQQARARAALASVIAANILLFAVLGGAVLARYMLTAQALVIILSLYEVKRCWRHWRLLAPLSCAAFLVGLLTPPPYHYAYDENLAYRDFVKVHRDAAAFVSRAGYSVITAWPATDELSNPLLGYVTAPMEVHAVPEFLIAQVKDAAMHCPRCSILFFATQYEPADSAFRPGPILRRLAFWKAAQSRFETRAARLSAKDVAEGVGGHVVWYARSGSVDASVISLKAK